MGVVELVIRLEVVHVLVRCTVSVLDVRVGESETHLLVLPSREVVKIYQSAFVLSAPVH